MLLLNTTTATNAARNENGKLDHLGGELSSSPSYQIDGLFICLSLALLTPVSLSRRELGCTVAATFTDRDHAQCHLDAVHLAAARVFASARTHHLQVSGLSSLYEVNVP